MVGVTASEANPTPQELGRRLRAVLRSDAAYAILDRSPAEGGTWLEGGCALLALALSRIGYGPLRVLEGRSGPGQPIQVQHWLVQAQGGFLDGDGFSTGASLLRRWKTLEHVLDSYVRSPRPEDRSSSTYTSATDLVAVRDLEQLLRQRI